MEDDHRTARTRAPPDQGRDELSRIGAPTDWTTTPVARFAYEEDGTYTLLLGHSDGNRDYYLDLESNQILEVLIDQVGQDPHSVFWG